MEVEVERSEEEIRADRAYNVKEYFKSKKSGTDFTPIDVKTTKRVPGRRSIGYVDNIERFIKDKDLYSDEVKSNLDHFKSFMDLFSM